MSIIMGRMGILLFAAIILGASSLGQSDNSGFIDNRNIYVDAEQGLSIIAFGQYNIAQGVLRMGWFYNNDVETPYNTFAEVFGGAIEGDCLSVGLPSNRVEYVFTFYDGDNMRHWLTRKSMALADDTTIPFGEIEYSRYQNVETTFTHAGAFNFPPTEDGQEMYVAGRKYTQGYVEDKEILRLVSLKHTMPLPTEPPDSRDPRRFYIRLKDGTRAIAAHYPGSGDRFFSSGVTWRKLFVNDNDIEAFEIIDDDSFPPSLCLPKSEVDDISTRFFEAMNGLPWYKRLPVWAWSIIAPILGGVLFRCFLALVRKNRRGKVVVDSIIKADKNLNKAAGIDVE